MAKKVKLGCVGVSGRGNFLINIAAENPDVEVTAICDANEETLEQCKEGFESKGFFGIKYYTSYEDFLKSDVEAVIIAVPIELHTDFSVMALNANKDVFCEIPIFSNLDEAKKLYKAVAEHPEQKFMTAENCCFWAFVHSWKKMYESGMLGRAVVAEAEYLHNTKYPEHYSKRPDKWRAFLPAITYITHSLGPLIFMLNDECESVYGFAPEYNPYKENYPGDPNGIAVIRMKSGALINILISFGAHAQCVHNFSLHCVDGTLQTQFNLDNFDNEGCETLAMLRNVPNTPGNDYIKLPLGLSFPNSKFKSGHGGADSETINAFVQAIIKNEPVSLGFKEGYHMSMPGILAYESSQQNGIPMKVPTLEELLK